MKKLISLALVMIMTMSICICANAATPKIVWDYNSHSETLDYLGEVDEGVEFSTTQVGRYSNFVLKFTASQSGFYEIITNDCYVNNVSRSIIDESPYMTKSQAFSASNSYVYYFDENEAEYIKLCKSSNNKSSNVVINYLGEIESFSLGDKNIIFYETITDGSYSSEKIKLTFSEGKTFVPYMAVYSDEKILIGEYEFYFTVPGEGVKRTFKAEVCFADKFIRQIELSDDYEAKFIEYYNSENFDGDLPSYIVLTESNGNIVKLKSGQTFNINGIDYDVNIYASYGNEKICVSIGRIYYYFDVPVEKASMIENIKLFIQYRTLLWEEVKWCIQENEDSYFLLLAFEFSLEETLALLKSFVFIF